MQQAQKNLQPYNVNRDARAVFDLWHTVRGETWPIAFANMLQVLSGPGAYHLVIREGEQLAGFVATLTGKRGVIPTGHLVALLVAPHLQGQGLGTSLYKAVLHHLSTDGGEML